MACTFVDNPDTDTSFGEQVVSSKLLAYAYMLTAEGYPFVYGKDYFTGDVWPGAYGLKPWIDNLIWIHETLASGPTVNRWVDGVVIVQNRTGWPGLLTALNFDTWNVREITCDTAFGPNAQLHDYTGRHPDIWTDGQGRATFRIPSNAFQGGQSYLCFSRPGFGAPISRIPRRTTQTFFGAADLDTAPATPGRSVEAGRIWCRCGTPIGGDLVATARDGMHTRDVSFAIRSPSGATVAAGSTQAEGVSGATGWHTLSVNAAANSKGSASYELTVEYTGTPEGVG